MNVFVQFLVDSCDPVVPLFKIISLFLDNSAIVRNHRVSFFVVCVCRGVRSLLVNGCSRAAGNRACQVIADLAASIPSWLVSIMIATTFLLPFHSLYRVVEQKYRIIIPRGVVLLQRAVVCSRRMHAVRKQ